MTLRIYGAGMAGLLAAEMLRKSRPGPIVHEAQSKLPDNHGALLRFRSDAVARETRQLFRKVRVLKAIRSGGRLRNISTIRDANMYSAKVTGDIGARSIIDLAPCDRYIAPDNFLTMLARDAIIKTSHPLTPEILTGLRGQKDVTTISTVPMPVLMEMVGWTAPRFSWRPVWSISADLGPSVDVFQTIYYPDPNDRSYYRASITGSRVIIEWATEPGCIAQQSISEVLDDFGIPDERRFDWLSTSLKRQEYGKLLPIADDRARQEFILAMTDEYNLYSVGRFATWRQILLDDVVNDIRVVEQMITQRNGYQRRLASGGALGG